MEMRSNLRHLTLEELLSDPVVQVMMARDRVDPEEIRALFLRVAKASISAKQ